MLLCVFNLILYVHRSHLHYASKAEVCPRSFFSDDSPTLFSPPNTLAVLFLHLSPNHRLRVDNARLLFNRSNMDLLSYWRNLIWLALICWSTGFTMNHLASLAIEKIAHHTAIPFVLGVPPRSACWELLLGKMSLPPLWVLASHCQSIFSTDAKLQRLSSCQGQARCSRNLQPCSGLYFSRNP